MQTLLRSLVLIAVTCSVLCPNAMAQDRSLQPKYGAASKSEADLAADLRFITAMDQRYNGDRKRASQDTAARGWQALREGMSQDAMRRFNQAWLLNASNGHALWGMGAVEGANGKANSALKLFQEADQTLSSDIDFAADYARTLGMAGAETKNDALLQSALSRFADIQQREPQHTLNLQNWAITLFSMGNYAEAWAKIQLAEATPRHKVLDRRFIAVLQEKMPRP